MVKKMKENKMISVYRCGRFKITIEDLEEVDETSQTHLYLTCLHRIAQKHDIKEVSLIEGHSRKNIHVLARWEFWNALQLKGFSIMQIARITKRDHGTIRHGLLKFYDQTTL
jgi:hypothetical protein